MTSHIRLSICIPTYNRRDYLLQAVESIIREAPPNLQSVMEICISDNASTDGTTEAVRALTIDSPVPIRYLRQETNLGADRNYDAVVSMAIGDYCWLFGSDDLAAPGSVKAVFTEITTDSDIYLFSRTECDKEMTPMRSYRLLRTGGDRAAFDTVDESQLVRYFSALTDIGGVFSYLSFIVFRRRYWRAYAGYTEYFGTAYYHAAQLLATVANGAKVSLLETPIVNTRLGNDSFIDKGMFARYMLDFQGYLKLSQIISIRGKPAVCAFLKVLKRTHPVYPNLIAVRMSGGGKKFLGVRKIFQATGYSSAEIYLTYLFAPMVVAAKHVRRVAKSLL